MTPSAWWPWNWGRKRDRQPTTQELLLMVRHAGDQGVLGVVETCLGLWADTVAGAEVEAAYPVTPAERTCFMREWLLRGEAVRRLDVVAGRPMLTPAIISHVHGDSTDPSTWRYVLQVASPNRVTVGTYPAARVLHWRRSPSTSMPWRGRSVMDDCPALATLAGLVERALVGEHRVPTSRLADIRIPWRQSNQQEKTARETMPVANLVGDGEVQVQRLDRGQDSPAPGSWRIGPEPEAASVDLRDQVRRDVAGAFGVSPGLAIAETGSAQATRELRSLWLRGRVLPVLTTLAAELARVLDSPVAFRLPMIDDERAEAESRRQQRRAMAIGNLMARGLTQDAATSVYDAG